MTANQTHAEDDQIPVISNEEKHWLTSAADVSAGRTISHAEMVGWVESLVRGHQPGMPHE